MPLPLPLPLDAWFLPQNKLQENAHSGVLKNVHISGQTSRLSGALYRPGWHSLTWVSASHGVDCLNPKTPDEGCPMEGEVIRVGKVVIKVA